MKQTDLDREASERIQAIMREQSRQIAAEPVQNAPASFVARVRAAGEMAYRRVLARYRRFRQ